MSSIKVKVTLPKHIEKKSKHYMLKSFPNQVKTYEQKPVKCSNCGMAMSYANGQYYCDFCGNWINEEDI